MRRRDLVTLAAGALFSAPVTSLAQTGAKRPVVGFLGIAARLNHLSDIEAFRLGLEQLGYLDGQTMVIE